jgi:tetraacyldisaccharide 4'-kinase
VVIISADATAPHQSVITVMEAARRVGLTQITFATQSSAGPRGQPLSGMPPPQLAPFYRAGRSTKVTGSPQGWPACGAPRACAWALWPVSLLYRALVACGARLYKARWFQRASRRSGHRGGQCGGGRRGQNPGGDGLVRTCRPGLAPRRDLARLRPQHHDCRAVLPDSPASAVGDEPALIARQCQVPVFVARQRIQAARALLAQHPDTDVLVCDDGLQHLALARDIEICVFNAQGVGNGFLLPAGPCASPGRAPWTGCCTRAHPSPPAATGGNGSPAFAVQRRLAPMPWRRRPAGCTGTLQRRPLHAVAAIARPEEFFAMLRGAGACTLAQAEALPDHYDFDSWSRFR